MDIKVLVTLTIDEEELKLFIEALDDYNTTESLKLVAILRSISDIRNRPPF